MKFIIIIIIYFKAQTLPPQTFGSGSVPDCPLDFFSTYPTLTRLYHTHHTFEKHHTHMFIQTFKQLLWTYFPVPCFSKFSFPPLIFSPFIRLSHQYGYVQVQLCKSNKQRLKQIDQIIVNLLHFWAPRSEERCVGKECWCPCRSRWSPYH